LLDTDKTFEEQVAFQQQLKAALHLNNKLQLKVQ